MYFYYALDARTNKRKRLKVIGDEELQDTKEILRYLDSVVSSDIKYEMIRRNDAEFLRYCDNLKPTCVNDTSVFIEVNRLLENAVNSFYSWIGFHEKEFKTVFGCIKGGYFDNNDEYKLFYGLRTYCDHHALPFKTVTMRIDNEEIVLDLDPKPIWEAKKSDGQPVLNEKIREVLKKLIDNEDAIHLRELVIGFDLLIPKIEKDIMKEIWAGIKPRIEGIVSSVKDIPTQFLYITDDMDNPVTGNMVAPLNRLFEIMEKYGARIPQ